MDNKQFARRLLEQAKMDLKQDWKAYERYKKQLQGLCLPPEVYEAAVKELAEILFL